MLEQIEIEDVYRRLNIPDKGRAFVDQIRNSPPLRRVRGGKSNVVGRFPSKKMGQTIQYDSRTCEHVFLLGAEIDPDILEIWDQSASLALRYKDSGGRNRGHREIIDYLTISPKGIKIIQCKLDDDLEEWESKNPERFSRDGNGHWISLAGEKSAAEYGFEYQVWSPSRSSVILSRNAEFLLDYFNNEAPSNMNSSISQIGQIVNDQKVIRLDKLIEWIGCADSVHFAIAKFEVYFDFESELVFRPTNAFAFSSQSHLHVHQSNKGLDNFHANPLVEIAPGLELSWNKRNWRVINVGDTAAAIQSEDQNVISLRNSDLERLIESGDIKKCPESNEDPLVELLQSTSEKELSDALEKYRRLELWCEGNRDLANLPDRTARDWRKKVRDSEIRFGSGLFGLVSNVKNRGNRCSRLSGQQEKILEESFVEDFETSGASSYRTAYVSYLGRTEKKGVERVSYPTYVRRLEQRDEVDQLVDREGKKSAYQIQNQHSVREGKNEEEPPAHGDRAWHIAHVDHTQLEIELSSTVTDQALGRPWLTLLIDSFSRFVFAFWLSFENPSYRSVMMVMRRCVERFSRVPQVVVVDQGAEFNSTYSEVLFAKCEIEKRERPGSEPRYGSPVERKLGTSQSQFIHALVGNTKNRRLNRGLSKSHDPSLLACWPPDAFEARLDEYLFDVYPRLTNTGIAEAPLNRLERSQSLSGKRAFARIPYDEAFYLLTLPLVEGVTRKVTRGTITVYGLEYSGFSRPLGPFNGQNFQVKYDPYDPLYVWAFIEGCWERLVCAHDILREYSESNIKMAHMEVTARLSQADREYRTVSERLVKFLSDVKAQEKLLISQKNSDAPSEVVVKENEGVASDSSVVPISFAVSRLRSEEESE